MVTKNLKKQVISIFVLITIFFVGKTIAESIEFRIIDPNNFPDEFAKMSDAAAIRTVVIQLFVMQ